MFTKPWWAACGLALSLHASPAAAAPLSLEQALAQAVERSHQTRAYRAAEQGATERARAAGQQADPSLRLGFENLPITGAERLSPTAEPMTMKRVGIAQEWVPASKRAAREAVAEARVARERTAEQEAAAQVRLQAALAFLDAYFAAESLKISEETERHLHEEVAVARGELAGNGSSSSAEALALSGELGLAEDDSGELRQQQAAAAAAMQRWIGTATADLQPPQLAAAPAEAPYVAAHPAVLARQREVEIALRELDVVRLDRRPNWTWELAYSQRQGRADMVSVGVNIPLTLDPAQRQDRETAARLALVEQADAALAEAQRAAAGEYAAQLSDAERLQERITHYRAAVLQPMRQRMAAALAAYGAGQGSLMTLFQARHAELRAQQKLLGLQREQARSQARLLYTPIAEGVAP